MPDPGPSEPEPAHHPRSSLHDVATDTRRALTSEPLLFVAAVVGIVVAAVCSVVIAELIADVTRGDDAARLDPRVLDWVVDHRTTVLTTLARSVTHLADTPVVIALTAACTIALTVARRPRLAMLVVASTVGVAILTTVAKYTVDRSRPPPSLWLGAASGPSFPSGHAAQAVALCGALAIVGCALLSRPVARASIIAGAVTVAVLVGGSRVYLAVHWPSDVLAGWAIATLWLSVLLLLAFFRTRISAIGRPSRKE